MCQVVLHNIVFLLVQSVQKGLKLLVVGGQILEGKSSYVHICYNWLSPKNCADASWIVLIFRHGDFHIVQIVHCKISPRD